MNYYVLIFPQFEWGATLLGESGRFPGKLNGFGGEVTVEKLKELDSTVLDFLAGEAGYILSDDHPAPEHFATLTDIHNYIVYCYRVPMDEDHILTTDDKTKNEVELFDYELVEHNCAPRVQALVALAWEYQRGMAPVILREVSRNTIRIANE